MKRVNLNVESLERRMLLAADIAVSATRLPDIGNRSVFEVQVSNLGDAAFDVQLDQGGVPLENAAWDQRSSFPALVDLRSLQLDQEFTPPWATDGFYGYAVFGARFELLGQKGHSAGDFNADGIDDFIISSDNDLLGEGEADRTYVLFGTRERRQDLIAEDFIDGVNGFTFRVDSKWDTGDFNGDGIDDIVLSVADDGLTSARSHVVFGSSELNSLPDVDRIGDGTAGFTIFNTLSREGRLHFAENAGDVNGDGVDDIILPVANEEEDLEEFAFIYGGDDVNSTIDTIDLDGEDGSIWSYTASLDLFRGLSSTIGDINGDGRDEYFQGNTGRILLGTSEQSARVAIDDLSSGQFVTREVRRILDVGDLNGDGFDDVLQESIDRTTFDPTFQIVFGSEIGIGESSESVLLSYDNADGYSRRFASVVTTADINGDGLDDAVISDSNGLALGPDSSILQMDPFTDEGPGVVYVLYGATESFPAEIDLRTYLDGETGFSIEGFTFDSDFGEHLSVGDFNGDGVDDLLSSGGETIAPRGEWSGAAHVIFGIQSHVTSVGPISTTVNVFPRNPITFRVEGEVPADASGAISFTAFLADSEPDSNPDNNSARFDVEDVDHVLAGDVDGNGAVEFDDFLILAANFGKHEASFGEGDVDENGVVEFADFLILSENFGRASA